MVMNSPAKFIAAFLFACIFTISNSNLVAQSMHGEPELDAAIPYSEPYAGQALWISYTFEGWPQYPLYASAVRINQCWGLTAGHVILNTMGSSIPRENFLVGNGTNWIDDRGIEREVAEAVSHPSWDGSWNGSKADVALVRFSQPLPGVDLEIGALGLGEVFEYAGFGQPATPGTGFLPIDGQRRGWDAKAHYWGGGGVSSKYVRSNFWQGELSLGGIGTGGGSGSGGFNVSGELVSLLVYQSGSPNYAGASFGLRLDLYQDWIESYTNDLSCLPPSPPRPHVSILDTKVTREPLSFCHNAMGC